MDKNNNFDIFQSYRERDQMSLKKEQEYEKKLKQSMEPPPSSSNRNTRKGNNRPTPRHSHFYQHHLYRFFSYEDMMSGSFTHLDPTMENLTPDGGVKKVLMQKGGTNKENSPVSIGPEDYVSLHFISVVEETRNPLDSSRSDWEFLRPFRLGQGELLQGMEIGIGSMEVGEVSKFLLTPEYAYGKLGCPPFIPAKARILLVIEIVNASPQPIRKDLKDMSMEELADLPFQEIYEGAVDLKDKGNEKFKQRLFTEAVRTYKQGIEVLEGTVTSSQDEEDLRLKLIQTLFSNMALSHLRQDEPIEAMIACRSALKPGMPEPRDGKIFYRYAEATFILGKYEEALAIIKLAIMLEPNVQELKFFKRRIEFLHHQRHKENETP